MPTFNIQRDVARGVGRGIGINKRNGGGGLASVTRNKLLFLWTGKFYGDNLDNDLGVDVITVNSKDFATTYIPYTSSATFNIPDTSPYQNADGSDNLWYDGEVQNVTVANLTGADFDHTFVKYDNQSPHHIQAIGILKSGESLDSTDEDNLTKFFELNITYFGTWNDNGKPKENR